MTVQTYFAAFRDFVRAEKFKGKQTSVALRFALSNDRTLLEYALQGWVKDLAEAKRRQEAGIKREQSKKFLLAFASSSNEALLRTSIGAFRDLRREGVQTALFFRGDGGRMREVCMYTRFRSYVCILAHRPLPPPPTFLRFFQGCFSSKTPL